MPLYITYTYMCYIVAPLHIIHIYMCSKSWMYESMDVYTFMHICMHPYTNAGGIHVRTSVTAGGARGGGGGGARKRRGWWDAGVN